MDKFVEAGSNWFCTAAHVVGATSFEMQVCGASGSRYAVGLAVVATVSLLMLITLMRLIAGPAERA